MASVGVSIAPPALTRTFTSTGMVSSRSDGYSKFATITSITDVAAHWELEVRENADPQAILQACFSRRIRLRSFNQSDPTLHEVFMRLVGPDAKEAAFR